MNISKIVDEFVIKKKPKITTSSLPISQPLHITVIKYNIVICIYVIITCYICDLIVI